MSFDKAQSCFINAAGLEEDIFLTNPPHLNKLTKLSNSKSNQSENIALIMINDTDGREREKMSYSDSLDSLSGYSTNNLPPNNQFTSDQIINDSKVSSFNFSKISNTNNLGSPEKSMSSFNFIPSKKVRINGFGQSPNTCCKFPSFNLYSQNEKMNHSELRYVSLSLLSNEPIEVECSDSKINGENDTSHSTEEMNEPVYSKGVTSSVSCDSLENFACSSDSQVIQVSDETKCMVSSCSKLDQSCQCTVNTCFESQLTCKQLSTSLHTPRKLTSPSVASKVPVNYPMTSFSEVSNHTSCVSINFVKKKCSNSISRLNNSSQCGANRKNTFMGLKHCSKTSGNIDNNSKMFNLFVRLDESDSTDSRPFKSVISKNKDSHEVLECRKLFETTSKFKTHEKDYAKGSNSYYMFVDADSKNCSDKVCLEELKCVTSEKQVEGSPASTLKKSPGVYMYISADDMKSKNSSAKPKRPNFARNVKCNTKDKKIISNPVMKSNDRRSKISNEEVQYQGELPSGEKFFTALVNEVNDDQSLTSFPTQLYNDIADFNSKISHQRHSVTKPHATTVTDNPTNKLGDFVSLECIFDEMTQKPGKKINTKDQFLNQLEALKTTGLSKSDNSIINNSNPITDNDFHNSLVFEKFNCAPQEELSPLPISEQYNLLTPNIHQAPSDVLSAFNDISNEDIARDTIEHKNESMSMTESSKRVDNSIDFSIETVPSTSDVLGDSCNTNNQITQASFQQIQNSADSETEETTGRNENDLLYKFLNQIDTDLILETGGKEISAHSSVLMSRCPYFTALLGSDVADTVYNSICLTEYSYEAVHFAICHIYGTSEKIPSYLDISELADLANKLTLDDLKSYIEEALESRYCHEFHTPCQRCIIGVVETLELADTYGLDDLGFKCLQWITEYFIKVWPTKYFIVLPENLLSRCYQYAVDQLNPDNVLYIMLDCIKLLRSLPRMKRSDTIILMVNELMNESKHYTVSKFSDVLSSPSFQELGQQESWNLNMLQDFLVDCCQQLQPKEACKSHKQLQIIKLSLKSITNLKSYEELIIKMYAEVEEHLLRNANRVMTCPQWFCLNSALQKKIKDSVMVVKSFDKLSIQPKFSSINKKISSTFKNDLKIRSSKPASESFQEIMRPQQLTLKPDSIEKSKFPERPPYFGRPESRSASISSTTSSERHNSRSPLGFASRDRSSSASVASHTLNSPNFRKKSQRSVLSESAKDIQYEDSTDNSKSFSTSTFKKNSSSSFAKDSTVSTDSLGKYSNRSNKSINSSTLVKEKKKSSSKGLNHCDTSNYLSVDSKVDKATPEKYGGNKKFTTSKSFPTTPYRTNETHQVPTRIPTIDMKMLSSKKPEPLKKYTPPPTSHILLDPTKATKTTSLRKKSRRLDYNTKSSITKESISKDPAVPITKKTIPPMQRSSTFCKDSGSNP